MTRKIPFVSGNIYHVYNRGVEKRTVFREIEDYAYFEHILKVFNSEEPASNTRYHFYRSRTSINKRKQKPLVELEMFCLMPNHYHLLLRQKAPHGISRYLQKIGTGYTHFFNKKYNRSGVLFQGKTKSQSVEKDNYFRYAQEYIFLNPLELFEKDWKERGVRDSHKAATFLESYRWVWHRNPHFKSTLFAKIRNSYLSEFTGVLKSNFDNRIQ